jgi:hypothetical protein
MGNENELTKSKTQLETMAWSYFCGHFSIFICVTHFLPFWATWQNEILLPFMQFTFVLSQNVPPKHCENFKVVFSLCFLLLLLHLCTYFLCHSLYQQETPFFLPYILLPIGSPLIFLLPFYLHRSCLCLHPFKIFSCSGLAITWPPLTHFSL